MQGEKKLVQGKKDYISLSAAAIRFVGLSVIILLFFSEKMQSQQLLISNGTVSACSGQFLDDSGTTGSYSNNNYTFTLCSSTAGQSISLLFQGVSLGVDASNSVNSDYLSIYDGNTVNASTLIGTYTGSALQGQTIQASFQNTSGCLTFVFQNGSAPNGAGWEAQISCYNPCNRPTAVVTTPQLQAAPSGYGVMACAGEAALFSAQSSTAPAGNTLVTYIWNFGDGTPLVTTSSSTISHVYMDAGQYLVHLTVITNTSCTSNNQTQYKVMVSSRPTFTDLPDIDPGPHLTCANPTLLTFDAGAVQHHSWNAIPPLVVSEPLYLPDMVNVEFISTLTFDDFPNGTTISNCADVENIFVNIEHAFVGDLDIWIECPNGTSVSLTESGAGFAYLGVPFSGDSPTPGVGWDYFWSPTATNGTWMQNVPSTPPSSPQTLAAGTYEPVGNLCNLVGCPLNGDWTIHIVDNFSSSNGYLFSWGLGLGQNLFTSLPTFTPTTASSYWTGPFISSNQQGAVFSPSNPTLGTFDYTYHVVTNYGCTFDSVVAITFNEPSVITAGPDKNFTCNPIMLEAEILTSSPYSYQWSWSPTTGLSNPNIANPTVNNLTQTTSYTLTVIPVGFPECAQTDVMVVNVAPPLSATLNDVFNGCAGTTITLPAPITSGGVSPISIQWIAPNGQVFNQPTIDVIPVGADIYCAVVTDGCNDPDTLCTLVSTPPAINATFSIAENTGCEPFSALMLADYTQVQNVTSMIWHFGDNEQAEVLSSANHQYKEPGVYYPWLEITDTYGCVYSDTTDNPILVWPTPVAQFSYIPENPVIPNTTIEFFNESSGGLVYNWSFDTYGQSTAQDTSIAFPIIAGKYPATLVAYNQYGCSDSLTKLIDIKDDLIVFIPNAFTPDGDGINDVWRIHGSGYRKEGFVLRVFNRWGEAIFEATSDETSWVGDTNLGEYYFVPDGIYTYRLEVVETNNDVKQLFTGSVLVIR